MHTSREVPGLIATRVSQTVVPRSIGEALTRAAVRLREYENVRVRRIMKVGMFKQALCKEVTSLLPEWFLGMSIMSGWGILLLSSIVKSKPIDEVLIEASVMKQKS